MQCHRLYRGGDQPEYTHLSNFGGLNQWATRRAGESEPRPTSGSTRGTTSGATSGPTRAPTRSLTRAPTTGPRGLIPNFLPFKDSHESSRVPRRRPQKIPRKCPVKWLRFTCFVFACSVRRRLFVGQVGPITPRRGKSCFSHRALAKARFVRLRNAFKYCAFEASKLVSTKTLFLKHCYHRQGCTYICTFQRFSLEFDFLVGCNAPSSPPHLPVRRSLGSVAQRLHLHSSLSPKAGHNKAGRSDFRNQRFEPDPGKNAGNAEGPSHPTKTRI